MSFQRQETISSGVQASTPIALTNQQGPIYFTCVVNGSPTYNLERTAHRPFLDDGVTVNPSAVWFIDSNVSAATGNKDGFYAGPVAGLRINQTGGAAPAGVRLTVLSL